MKSFSIDYIAKVLGGRIVVRGSKANFSKFTKQPKDKPKEGSLYFLRGGFDSEEKLLKQLVDNKVAGIVIDKPHNLNKKVWNEKGISVIEVQHMSYAYIELAKAYRKQFHIPFIEVIGSSGKTTTKEMIGAVLNEKIKTLVGLENLNAPSGVAYNIFRIRDHHKAAVLEVGMKAKGIMAYSSGMVKPDIAVLTTIHRAHFARFGSIEDIIEAKSEIMDYLSPKGILIMNGDDENCRRFPIDRFSGKVLTFGFSNKCDIWAENIRYEGLKTYFDAVGRGYRIPCMINTVGSYNVSNALSAILAGFQLGLQHEEIVRGLSSFKPLNSRLKVYKGIEGTTLIDDNFNANPDSTKALIRDIPLFTQGRPVVLVIGDMENPEETIGEYARKVHYMIGEEISRIKFDHLVAVGKWAEEYVKGAVHKGAPASRIHYFKSIEEARQHILEYVVPGSIIIFKASSAYARVNELMEPLKINKEG